MSLTFKKFTVTSQLFFLKSRPNQTVTKTDDRCIYEKLNMFQQKAPDLAQQPAKSKPYLSYPFSLLFGTGLTGPTGLLLNFSFQPSIQDFTQCLGVY